MQMDITNESKIKKSCYLMLMTAILIQSLCIVFFITNQDRLMQVFVDDIGLYFPNSFLISFLWVLSIGNLTFAVLKEFLIKSWKLRLRINIAMFIGLSGILSGFVYFLMIYPMPYYCGI